MDEKTIVIADTMGKIEAMIRSQLKKDNDPLLIAGALMAVTRNLYVEALGIEDAGRVFATIADSFHMTEEMLKKIKPTIH